MLLIFVTTATSNKCKSPFHFFCTDHKIPRNQLSHEDILEDMDILMAELTLILDRVPKHVSWHVANERMKQMEQYIHDTFPSLHKAETDIENEVQQALANDLTQVHERYHKVMQKWDQSNTQTNTDRKRRLVKRGKQEGEENEEDNEDDEEVDVLHEQKEKDLLRIAQEQMKEAESEMEDQDAQIEMAHKEKIEDKSKENDAKNKMIEATHEIQSMGQIITNAHKQWRDAKQIYDNATRNIEKAKEEDTPEAYRYIKMQTQMNEVERIIEQTAKDKRAAEQYRDGLREVVERTDCKPNSVKYICDNPKMQNRFGAALEAMHSFIKMRQPYK